MIGELVKSFTEEVTNVGQGTRALRHDLGTAYGLVKGTVFIGAGVAAADMAFDR